MVTLDAAFFAVYVLVEFCVSKTDGEKFFFSLGVRKIRCSLASKADRPLYMPDGDLQS